MSQWRWFRFDAVGLKGLRLHLVTDIPTDGMAPVELPEGTSDVIAVADEPNVHLNVQVHPVGDPATVVSVRFDQLAVDEGDARRAGLRHPVYPNTTGLAGRQMRLATTTDSPADDAPGQSSNPPEHIDVVCLDDAPSVFGSVRVHPVDDPTAVAVAAIDHLALYTPQPRLQDPGAAP
jgi:hypothetical protein